MKRGILKVTGMCFKITVLHNRMVEDQRLAIMISHPEITGDAEKSRIREQHELRRLGL